ncbi:hypothetical protein CBL_01395 [Carabus blaptoides fortunei]
MAVLDIREVSNETYVQTFRFVSSCVLPLWCSHFKFQSRNVGRRSLKRLTVVHGCSLYCYIITDTAPPPLGPPPTNDSLSAPVFRKLFLHCNERCRAQTCLWDTDDDQYEEVEAERERYPTA